MKFDNFDKDFKKTEKRIFRTFWTVLIINVVLSIAVLGGIAWLVYAVLKYFGIVG